MTEILALPGVTHLLRAIRDEPTGFVTIEAWSPSVLSKETASCFLSDSDRLRLAKFLLEGIGGEHMIIGVVHYCENEKCKVETYSCTVDEVAADDTNCPGCGQFGRTKGRPAQSSRSIGLPGADEIKDPLRN